MSNHPPYKTEPKPGNSDWEERLFTLRALVGLAMFGIAFLSYPFITLLWLLGDVSSSWVPFLSLGGMATVSVGALVFPEKSPWLGVSFALFWMLLGGAVSKPAFIAVGAVFLLAFWALSWWKDVY